MSAIERAAASLRRQSVAVTVAPEGDGLTARGDGWVISVFRAPNGRPLFRVAGTMDENAGDTAVALLMAAAALQVAAQNPEPAAAELTAAERRRLARCRKRATADDRAAG